jgi:isopentenyl-diphosphate delta-isomerase
MESLEIIKVSELDEVLGFVSKEEAHRTGCLHRAISVLIFNSKGEWLIQKRAEEKYHSAGLWANTCCSHPYPKETNINASIRRLGEEVGMVCELEKIFSFKYRVVLDNDLIEHEFDHVFKGVTNSIPVLNKNEVSDWKYVTTDFLKEDMIKNPNQYAEWFKLIFDLVLKKKLA